MEIFIPVIFDEEKLFQQRDNRVLQDPETRSGYEESYDW